MPLNQHQLNLLRGYCTDNPGGAPFLGAFGNPNLNIAANECACWRWTTAGLSANVTVNDDPAQVFNAIGFNTPLNQGSAWANGNGVPQNMQNYHNIYNQYVNGNYQPVNGVSWDDWFEQVVDTVASDACAIGGLTVGAGPQTNGERYFVCMHYERMTNGTINAPNYTHWWIGIHLGNDQHVHVEMFPGSTNVTFRFNNAYADADNVCLEVTDLTQAHMAVLNAILPQQ